MTAVYYKVLNNNENHNGYQYKEGLNVLNDEFDDNPNHHCVQGGLYYVAKENICNHLYMGDHIREVTPPADARVVKDGNMYRADKIILEKRIEYHSDEIMGSVLDTEKQQLFDSIYGVITNVDDWEQLIARYPELVDNKYTEKAIDLASENGHEKMVAWWFAQPAEIEKKYTENAIDWASARGHEKMVAWWLAQPAEIEKKYSDWAIDWASRNGHEKILKMIQESKK